MTDTDIDNTHMLETTMVVVVVVVVVVDGPNVRLRCAIVTMICAIIFDNQSVMVVVVVVLMQTIDCMTVLLQTEKEQSRQWKEKKHDVAMTMLVRVQTIDEAITITTT